MVDVEAEPRPTPSTAARSTATAPLRDCLSYYNDHGNAEPGSLAYYGGRRGTAGASRPRSR